MGIIPKFVRDFFIESPEIREKKQFHEAELQKKDQELQKEYVRLGAEHLKDSSITCRCNGLAIPTSERGKIYRCIRCNKQFANASYYLDLDCTYNDAVNLLMKNEK